MIVIENVSKGEIDIPLANIFLLREIKLLNMFIYSLK